MGMVMAQISQISNNSYPGTIWRYWSPMLCVLAVIANLFRIPQIYLWSRLGHLHNPKQSSAVIDKSTHVRDRHTDKPAASDNGQDGTEGNGECRVSNGGADTQVKDNDKKVTPSKSSKPKPSRNKRDGKVDGGGKRTLPQSVRQDDGSDDSGKGSGKGKNKRDDAPGTDNVNGFEIMQSLAYGVCLTLGASLLGELGIKFSTRHNAKYGLPDMYRMLLSMCCGSKESATAEGQYRTSKIHGNMRLPSRSWMLNHIRTVRHDFMLTRCQKMIRRSVKRAKRHGMLRQSIDVAIDEHDIPFHAKFMKMVYAVFSKGKKGTIRFNRLATVYCIVAGQQFTLGVEVVRLGDTNAEVVARLLEQCRQCNIRIATVTMDRGFYSTGVMATVRKAGYTLLMPAVKHSTIKTLIQKFDAGKLNAISEHTMSSGNLTESFKIIILRRKKAERKMSKEAQALAKLHEKQVAVEDEYYVFATTLPDSWIGGDPNRVSEFYKLRWGIENSYKSYEQLRPWTTSSSHSVRILLWFIPFVLYNLWMIARFITARKLATREGRPPCPLYLFVSCMLGELKAVAASGRPPD